MTITPYDKCLIAEGWNIVPILPAHGIVLSVPPHVREWLERKYRLDEGDALARKPGAEFARIMLSVWKRIPLSDRRAILRYWRSEPEPLAILLMEANGEEHAMRAMGACGNLGSTLFFSHELDVHAVDEPVGVSEIVAHELAHVYRYATVPPDQLLWESVERKEIETREVAIRWGFPQSPFSKKVYRAKIAYKKQVLAALRRLLPKVGLRRLLPKAANKPREGPRKQTRGRALPRTSPKNKRRNPSADE